MLGANDGIVSTASLVVGVAAADAGAPATSWSPASPGLVAGAMSMAAGEYVSVSSQADTETGRPRARAHGARDDDPEHELEELAAIYVGARPRPGARAAGRRPAHGARRARRPRPRRARHLRDDAARPVQAALASAATFAVGAAMPLLTVLWSPAALLIPVGRRRSLLFLALLGGVCRRAGGAPAPRGARPRHVLGALAMGLTAASGRCSGGGLSEGREGEGPGNVRQRIGRRG